MTDPGDRSFPSRQEYGTPQGPGRPLALRHRRPRARQTITYVVTGSSADVTYEPTRKGHVPVRVTRRLGNPQFYSITAQLSGGGQVRCKILVGGKGTSTAAATGSYNIASCETS